MEDFFTYDSTTKGSKGLVYIGNKLLIYRRDNNTDLFPEHLDVPGGGPEGNETPFETFKREVLEEFRLTIAEDDVVYVKKYISSQTKESYSYFPVVVLPAEATQDIQLGDEGSEYMLLTLDDYLQRHDAWPVFQQRAHDYKNYKDAK